MNYWENHRLDGYSSLMYIDNNSNNFELIFLTLFFIFLKNNLQEKINFVKIKLISLFNKSV